MGNDTCIVVESVNHAGFHPGERLNKRPLEITNARPSPGNHANIVCTYDMRTHI